MKQYFLTSAEKIFPQIQSIRHHLHQYPELSFQEYQTSQYIQNILKEWGVTYQPIAKTGVLAIIGNSKKTNKCIAIRADIDALPIQEKNNTSYTSQIKGVMHACGHDVHTACALGSIYLFKQIEKQINGTIKIIFQPGEEVLPGGATMIIKEKGLQNPRVNALIAQHVFPDLETGKVGFRAGPYMASTDEIHISIHGKGGHGAMPHRAHNPIPVAAKIIDTISNDYPIEKMLKDNIIISFGKIIANGSTNVIPETVELSGTMRTLHPNNRLKIYQYLKSTIQKIARQYRIKIKLNIKKGYPPLINHPALTEFFKQKAVELLGSKNVVELPIRMTADDFAYYIQKLPGTYYRLGTGNKKKGIHHNVHTPYFDIDEHALYYGTAVMSWLVWNYLNEY